MSLTSAPRTGQHDHGAHGHDHDHHHAPQAPRPTPPAFSLLRASAGVRLAGAAAALTALWGAVAWTLA